MKHSILLALTLAAAVFALDATAFAKRGGDDSRVRDRIELTADATPGRARLEVRRDSVDRQEIRLKIERATTGEDLRVFIADAQGTLVEVGVATERGASGRYDWRVRTKKGNALPFGQSDLSGLSGRAVEVRTAAGATRFAAAFPTIAPANAPSASKRSVRTNLAVRRAVAAEIGAPNLAARTEVSLRRGGRQRFGVHVEGVAGGQTFEVWIEDPVTGEMVFLSTLTTGSAVLAKDSGSSGDDEADDDGDDGDDDEGDDEQGDLDFDSDDGDDLPNGATSVSDLAGLDVEVRTVDGDVVAEGEVGTVGDDHRADDDDHDGHEDGDDDGDDGDESEDESEDD